jgi:hypothetical protein
MKNLCLFAAAAFVLSTSPGLAQTPASPTPQVKPAVVLASRADQALIDFSRSSWEGYKNKDVAAIKALTADGYHSNAVAGPSNLQQDIDNMSKLEITSYTIAEPMVTWAGSDVGILRYKADVKGSYEGTAFKPVYASEVWIKRGGKWRILSYTETPVI